MMIGLNEPVHLNNASRHLSCISDIYQDASRVRGTPVFCGTLGSVVVGVRVRGEGLPPAREKERSLLTTNWSEST